MTTVEKSAIGIVVTLGNLRIRILQNASEILNGSSEAPAAEKKQDSIGRQLAVGRIVGYSTLCASRTLRHGFRGMVPKYGSPPFLF